MDAPARRLPAEFRLSLAPDRAFTTLALELIDGTVAPAVGADGRIAGIDAKERGPAGTPPPADILEDEIVGAKPAGLLRSRCAMGAAGTDRSRPPPGPCVVARPRRPLRPPPAGRPVHGAPRNQLVQDLNAKDDPVRAVFASPLDLDGLRVEYELPSSLLLLGEVDAIVDRNTRAEIVGSRGVKRG